MTPANTRVRVCETSKGKVILVESTRFLSIAEMDAVTERCDVQQIDAPIVFAQYDEEIQADELTEVADAFEYEVPVAKPVYR